MKKFLSLALIFTLAVAGLSAQEHGVVAINDSGDYVSSKDGNLNLSVAGMMFSINNEGQAVPAALRIASNITQCTIAKVKERITKNIHVFRI